MPFRTLRSSTLGLPLTSVGRSGSTIAHSLSLRSKRIVASLPIRFESHPKVSNDRFLILELVVQLDSHQERRRHGVSRDLTRGVLTSHAPIADRIVHALDEVAPGNPIRNHRSHAAGKVDRAGQAGAEGAAVITNATEDVLAERYRFPGPVFGNPRHASIDLIPGRGFVVRACEEVAVLRIAPGVANRWFELTPVGVQRVKHVERDLVAWRVRQVV